MSLKARIYGLHGEAGPIFYIGSTKHTLAKRLREHKDMIRLGHNQNRHLVHTVNRIGLDNLKITLIEECPLDKQFEREHEIIRERLQASIRLTNIITNAYTPDPTYAQRVSEPSAILAGLEMLADGPPTAADERDQPIVDALYNLALSLYEAAQAKADGSYIERLREEAEWEASEVTAKPTKPPHSPS